MKNLGAYIRLAPSKGVFYRNVFTQALYLNRNSKVIPGLFNKWKLDAGKKTYIFTFDKRHTFGSGREIMSKDIEFSLCNRKGLEEP